MKKSPPAWLDSFTGLIGSIGYLDEKVQQQLLEHGT
jgi:hypothetical protein